MAEPSSSFNLIALHHTLSRIRETSRPCQKIRLLSRFVDGLDSEDRARLYCLLDPSSRLKKEIHVADKSLALAITKRLYSGDAEGLAETVTGTLDPTLKEAFQFLLHQASLSGVGSRLKKLSQIGNFINSCDSKAAEVLIRVIKGTLRCGLGEKLLVKVMGKHEDKSGFFEPPMLCSPLNERLFTQRLKITEYLAENKFDGFRVILVHNRDQSYCYTRKKELLKALPPVIENWLGITRNEECVLDLEVIGGSFQQISRVIMRKKDFEKHAVNLGVRIIDALMLNGTWLLDTSLLTRKQLLRQWCKNHKPQAYIADTPIADMSHLQKLLADAAARGEEGLVIKHRESRYLPGNRGHAWIKVKPAFNQADVVITGLQKGRGARSPYYAAVSIAAYVGGKLASVGEVGSGFTLGDLKQLKKMAQAGKVENQLVIEVHYQALQKSVNNDQYKMRFPVFKRFRYDKGIADLTFLNPG